MSNLFHYLRTLIPPILAFELFLGGQARITSLLTPRLYARAMAKAEGTRDALYPIIPFHDPERQTNVIGVLMMNVGAFGVESGERRRGSRGVQV
ncbi:hypothetical protein BDV96DRAFT_579349 [Lophiotrema nucula]|uniref:Uncharacterized protein n=1 Tax=Lophiotrema nucula TaxID=690887 RepID=A0A6A5Z217_9PLEO|nr:hypothetical protein BDV96DRAFT_579349 [Lophiotrema nucula]